MNVLSFIVEAKDKATATLDKIKGQFGELKADWGKAMAGMKEGSYSGLLSFAMKLGPAVAVVGTAIAGLGVAVKWLGEGLAEAAKIETFTIRMSKLTGSMDSAREAVRGLTSGKDAVDDLFGEDDVLSAAVALKRLSGGALGTAADIKVLAGAAYDTGQSVSAVAQDIGGLTGMITEGMTGWERYAKGLAKTGVLSFEAVKQMTDMKEAGRSAGEIVAYMWGAVEKDHSGTIEKARDSIDGLSKSAADSMGDMQRLLGEMIGKPFATIWNAIRIGFAEIISFIFGGIKDAAQFVGTFAGSLSAGDGVKGAYNAALDNYENGKKTGQSAGGDLEGTINAKSNQSDEQKAAAKKAADDTAELLKKKEEAQKKLEDEQRNRQEKVVALTKEKAGLLIDTQSRGSDGTDATIKAETRILEINQELLKLKKDITSEEEKRSEKEESLMKRDQNLREMAMTVEQRREASKKRAEALAAQLGKETDPDKRLAIKEKLMDEAEKQASLKNGLHSLSVRDLFTKSDKSVSGGKRDPVAEGNSILKRIEGILVDIKKTPGGMTK